jgi:hypothetical protein
MISSGYVYSDMDLACQCPALHLILTIINMEREQFEREAVTGSLSYYIEDILVICYYSDGYLVLINNWQDVDYFTGSFLMLFPLGAGGHISTPQKHKVPLSLKAWAKWALNHYSRRYIKMLIVICG